MAVENAAIAGGSHTGFRQVQPKLRVALLSPSNPSLQTLTAGRPAVQVLLSSLTGTAGLIGVLLEIHLFTEHPMFV